MPALTRRQEAMIRMLSTHHGRKNSDLCLCDGIRSSREILTLRPDLAELIVLRGDETFPIPLPVEPVRLPPADFERISNTVHSQGVLVLARRPEKIPEETPVRKPFSLVLDRISDPGNMGTILRTARAAGLKEVFLTEGCTDPFSDKTVRSASGAQFSLAIRTGGTLEAMAAFLKEKGCQRFYRTAPASGHDIFTEEKLYDNSAVILGNEGSGAAPLACGIDLNIPMPGDAESLNVAQAATIVLFEFVRRSFHGI